MVAPSLASKTSAISNGVATVIFEDLAPGIYGVIAVHDKNGNGTIDSNGQGMPVEDYGATNNALNFGPPGWEESKFSLGQNPQELEIRF